MIIKKILKEILSPKEVFYITKSPPILIHPTLHYPSLYKRHNYCIKASGLGIGRPGIIVMQQYFSCQ